MAVHGVVAVEAEVIILKWHLILLIDKEMAAMVVLMVVAEVAGVLTAIGGLHIRMLELVVMVELMEVAVEEVELKVEQNGNQVELEAHMEEPEVLIISTDIMV